MTNPDTATAEERLRERIAKAIEPYVADEEDYLQYARMEAINALGIPLSDLAAVLGGRVEAVAHKPQPVVGPDEFDRLARRVSRLETARKEGA